MSKLRQTSEHHYDVDPDDQEQRMAEWVRPIMVILIGVGLFLLGAFIVLGGMNLFASIHGGQFIVYVPPTHVPSPLPSTAP